MSTKDWTCSGRPPVLRVDLASRSFALCCLHLGQGVAHEDEARWGWEAALRWDGLAANPLCSDSPLSRDSSPDCTQRHKHHWDTQPLFFKTPVRGYNTDNKKAVNIASPSYIQTNTQVTHAECWQPTQIKAIFESLETSPLLVTVKTCLLHLNITIWHYLTTDWTNKNGNCDNLLKSIWKVVHLRVLKVF